MIKQIEYKGLKIKVERTKKNNFILSCENTLMISDNYNERSLEKLWRVINGVQITK